MNRDELKIEDLIKFPVTFDAYGGVHILDADGNMICEIRGWGRLQYGTDEKGNRVFDEALGIARQDFIGLWITNAINEKARRQTEK